MIHSTPGESHASRFAVTASAMPAMPQPGGRPRLITGRIASGSRQQVPVLGPVVAWGSSKGAWGFSVGRLDLKQLGFQGKPLF